MTPTYRKKLIEAALPLEAINRESAREKSIRHGHPSTLHLWWARRPLAACRAVLFASLVDDPDSDPAFRLADGSVDEERAGVRRAELFNLIEELVKWENSNNESILNRARAEIAACVASRKILDTREWKKDQAICNEKAWAFVCRTAKPANVNAFLAEHAPPVLDPFCGGGSIPLEAQRLGLRAYASDLNPVPVLITKALIEIPPKFAGRPPVHPLGRNEQRRSADTWKGAQGLAEDVRYYGKWMRDEAEKRIGHLYPKVKVTAEMAKDRPDLKPYVGEELTVIAWLWARTVASPNPAVGGAHVPLVKSFCLSDRKGREAWLEPIIEKHLNRFRFCYRAGKEPPAITGTIGRKGARCLISDVPIPFSLIRAEGKAGRLGTTLLGVVLDGKKERLYLSPDLVPVQHARHFSTSDVLEGDLAHNPFAVRPPLYGFKKFNDLFTARHLSTLVVLSELLRDVQNQLPEEARRDGHYVAIVTYLAFAISKCADYWNTVATWMPRGTVGHAFSKQAIPMTFDFPEANPFADFHCAWEEAFDWVAKVVETLPFDARVGTALQVDATAKPNGESAKLICTDPPYYNNIDYSDLADFFYVWLRRSLSHVYPQLFSTIATPKTQELVANPYRFDGGKEDARRFFESGLEAAFRRFHEIQLGDYPLTVFYAFKQTESDESDGEDSDTADGDNAVASTGWETMLEGLIRAGFLIDGTWPIRTERSARTMSIGMNALASSIVLSCRSRPGDAALATRREFLKALKQELPDALKHLQRGSIAPVDLAQAAIGPGMAVFTRYAKVMEADGSPMKVRQALALINQTLDEVLAEQEGEFDGDTRWALAWFEQFGMEDGPFGVAETLSKAKNTAVNGLVEAGIITARAGKVRLLKREELPPDWNPATDTRLRHWEIVQYLIRALETGGETAAADLLRKLGGMGEAARDLAYRLYNICERKKWAQDALAYNSLVIAWPEISKLARSGTRVVETQGEMF